RGLRAHAALGHWTGGRPPYGFRRVVRQPDGSTVPMPVGRWKAKGETIVLEIEPAAAQIVEQIYAWAVDHGLGLTAIADRLNRQGVPAPESLRRAGVVAWGKSTVRGILNNPLYRGTLTYGKARYSEIGKKRGKVARPATERIAVDGAVPVIVSAERW